MPNKTKIINDIRQALKNGMDVNSRRQYMYFTTTPLLDVSMNMNGNINVSDIIRQLGEAGADMNSRVERLGNIEKKIKIEFEGYTALMFAALYGKSDIIQLLFDLGANLDMKDKISGETALHIAVINNDIDMVNLLIQLGADPDIKDNHGCTALMSAVLFEGFDMVSLLISAGARVDIKNKNKNTARMLVNEYRNPNIAIAKLLDDAEQFDDIYSKSEFLKKAREYREIAKTRAILISPKKTTMQQRSVSKTKTPKKQIAHHATYNLNDDLHKQLRRLMGDPSTMEKSSVLKQLIAATSNKRK